MKNEKLQPTNNNVSNFTINKNTCTYSTKLQIANYKIASLQVCKFASYKLQIHKLQYYNF
jgi:hypothetical protein